MGAIKICLLLFAMVLLSESKHISVKESLYNCPDPTKAVTLLDKQGIAKDGAFLQHITYVYSLEGTTEPITCIDAKDLDTSGHGATVRISDGGIGYNYVNIELTSQLGRGINFEITVHGA